MPEHVSYFFPRGADIFGINVRGSVSSRKFLTSRRVLSAIRTFNLTHMNRGRNAYQASHCYSVADYMQADRGAQELGGDHGIANLSVRRSPRNAADHPGLRRVSQVRIAGEFGDRQLCGGLISGSSQALVRANVAVDNEFARIWPPGAITGMPVDHSLYGLRQDPTLSA